MTLHVKDAGTWKEVTAIYVKDAGSWKEATNAYVKDAGSWKEFRAPAVAGANYTISTSGTSGTGTTIDASFSVSPTGNSTTPAWTMSFVSSSPPGFWVGNDSSFTGWTPTVRSVSGTASPGTLVQLTYKVNFTSDGGYSDDTYVTYNHQF